MRIANNHYTELLKLINSISYSRDKWEVFYDFVEMAAICISNSVDIIRFEEKEQQYLKTIHKYSPEHQKIFPEMFAQLVLALEYEFETRGFNDVLGCLFHELELHNKYKGQFFTPQNICTMMGKMMVSENDKNIMEKGFITVSEPACGSGAMVLGFAQAMKECGYNHSKQMLIIAEDIDLKCVYMCYVQLALYCIPAIVIHGNTLTMERWSHWYTPVYMVGGFAWKRQKTVARYECLNQNAESNIELPSSDTVIKTFKQLNLFDEIQGE